MSPAQNNTVIYSDGRKVISSVTEEGDDESQLFKICLNSSNVCIHWSKVITTIRKEQKDRILVQINKCPFLKRNVNPDLNTQLCSWVFNKRVIQKTINELRLRQNYYHSSYIKYVSHGVCLQYVQVMIELIFRQKN
jgi:hypothetical protein